MSHVRSITALRGTVASKGPAEVTGRCHCGGWLCDTAACLPHPRSHTGAVTRPVIYKIDPAKTKQKGGEWRDLRQEEWSKHRAGIPGL